MATIWRDPVTEVWHSTFLRSNCTSEPEILQDTREEEVEHKELLLVVGLLTSGVWDNRCDECTVVDVTKAAIARKPTKFNPYFRLTPSRGGRQELLIPVEAKISVAQLQCILALLHTNATFTHNSNLPHGFGAHIHQNSTLQHLITPDSSKLSLSFSSFEMWHRHSAPSKPVKTIC